MASTITYDEFEAYSKDFATMSEKVGDSWELRTTNSAPAIVYLVKTCTQVLEADDAECDNLDQRVETDLVEESDDGVVQQRVQQCSVPVRLEFHVVYSVSYEVPTLYLHASYQNGKALSISDVWKLIPSIHDSSTNAKWSLLSQQDHPILNRPFYYIHPCHTATALSAVYSRPKDVRTVPDNINYILTWLSMFGPMVGLNVPLKYCDFISRNSI